MTECNAAQLEFHGLGRRTVVADFDGGKISSDGGVLLLREVEARTGILARLAGQFVDYRSAELVEHTVLELVAQRVLGLALGYEDLNDHDRPALGSADGGGGRQGGPDRPGSAVRARQGQGTGESSTLNRLELTPASANAEARYKKIVANPEGMDRLLVDCFLEAYDTPPQTIWIDLDATDDPIHGERQEGRFFHAYYDGYCYLPLYIFSGPTPAVRTAAPVEHRRLRGLGARGWAYRRVDPARWPDAKVVVRADSGFCREDLMAWCEAQGVDYVLGLAKNSRLLAASLGARVQAQIDYLHSGKPARVFCQFDYRTRETWSRERRVVGKAEHLAKGPNPRFVVTSLAAKDADARTLYEDLYCARGDMENRIKEQQLDLFADRTSTATLRANQIRLYFSSFAYVMLCALRRLGLADTELERAQCGTIRLRLLKIGAQVRISVRRVWVSFSESFPNAAVFRQALARIRGPALAPSGP